MELEQFPENEREQTFCQEQGWEEGFQESDRILGIIAMRHAREKVMSFSWNVGAQGAGSHKSDELPVSKMVFFFQQQGERKAEWDGEVITGCALARQVQQ